RRRRRRRRRRGRRWLGSAAVAAGLVGFLRFLVVRWGYEGNEFEDHLRAHPIQPEWSLRFAPFSCSSILACSLRTGVGCRCRWLAIYLSQNGLGWRTLSGRARSRRLLP